MATGRTDTLTVMPARKKTKDISEIKKPKSEKVKKEKKEKKPQISLYDLRRIYQIAVSEFLPDYDELTETAERKKLISSIKKALK